MANLSITAANVQAGANADTETHALFAAGTAGQVVYEDPTTHAWKVADNDAANAHNAAAILLSSGAANQPVEGQTDGDITIGATLVPGQSYYLSATPGAICLFSDLVTGDAVTLIGVAISASVLRLVFTPTGLVL